MAYPSNVAGNTLNFCFTILSMSLNIRFVSVMFPLESTSFAKYVLGFKIVEREM